MLYGIKWSLSLIVFILGLMCLSGEQPGMLQQVTAQGSEPTYTVMDLGTLPGGGFSLGFGINSAGEVVGEAQNANADWHAFRYSNGAMTDLGTLPGYTRSSLATGINSASQVCGYAQSADGLYRAFLYSNGIMTDLGALRGTPSGAYSFAYGINSAGIVGYAQNANGVSRAFLYSNGAMTDLGTLPGGDQRPGGQSWAFGINSAGQIVGESYPASGSHAFVYNGGMADLGTLPSGGESRATGINSAGQVVGWAEITAGSAHAFVYNGGMTDIGTLPGYASSYATGINSADQVVGYAHSFDRNDHAFLYSNGAMTDLNNLIPADSGWLLYEATGINDAGQITGYGSVNGQYRAFLLTPTSHCTVVRTVMMWSQGGGAAWACQVYGYHNCSADQILQCEMPPSFSPPQAPCAFMRQYGCGTTALAMALNYAGVAQLPNPFGSLTPGSLNDYMTANGLYSPGIDPVTGSNPLYDKTVAAINSAGLHFYDGWNNSRDPEKLDKALCFGYPVLVRVPHPTLNGSVNCSCGTTPRCGNYDLGHTVLVTGKQNGQYLINDPGRSANGSLDCYGNIFQIIGFVGPSGINTAAQASSARALSTVQPAATSLGALSIVGDGNEGLLVVDGSGRRAGYDPSSKRVLYEIPGSSYYKDLIADDELDDGPTIGGSNFLKINAIPDGTYRVIIDGTAQGPYDISVIPYSQDGSAQPKIEFQGTLEQGCSYFDIQYSSTPATGTQVGPVSCSWVSSLSQSFASSGAAGSISITAPNACNWSAASNASWIVLASGSSGGGNGTVHYTVTANTGNSNRSGTITIAGLTYTVYQGVQFADVPTSYLFYNEISKLSAHGITLGCGGGNFCPDQPVTREQMAAFIIRALGDFNPPAPTQQTFSDVPPSNQFYAFIDQLGQLDITLGCGNGNYCPSDPVTREQMAAFLIRTLGDFNPPTPASQRFLDVSPTNPFYAFIDELAARGITLGCGGGNYCPSSPVTRGQMAAFLVRAFNL